MTIFAFIFARGGSKGVPRKNLKILGGMPLLAHSVRMAQELHIVERVFVSTEDREIAELAGALGADVIDRPSYLATDTSPEWLAWRHAVEYVRVVLGLKFDTFLSLPATSPLRARADVEKCLQAFDETTDAVITVTNSARSPYFNMISNDENGYAHVVLGSTVFERRQDVPPVYDISTVAYVTRPDFVLAQDRLFDGRVKAVLVPKERAIDIDDEYDFRIAEAFFTHE